MSQWKNIAAVAALSISAALGGTGCLAQQTADETANQAEIAAAQPEQDVTATADSEKTGEANQAWWGGRFGGFGGWGGWGGWGLGGWGLGGWGFGGYGLGLGYYGGFGGCGGCLGGYGLGGYGLGFAGCGGCF